jgi:hypothetical protein
MSRHARDGDPEFGSDSFLDIIANIVGILIILIVVAGVKVAKQPVNVVQQQPVQAAEADTTPPQVFVSEEEYAAVEYQANQLVEQTQQLLADSEELFASALQLTNERSELVKESARLKSILTSHEDSLPATDAQSAAIDAERKRLEARTLTLHRELADAQKKQRLMSASLEDVLQRQEDAETELRESAKQMAHLEELLLEEQQESLPHQERLEHRLSPVARTTSEQELHFRMSSGRIAWVPLEPLLDRLKSQVTSRADVVRRFGKYEGMCGPVGGFVMKYSVERVAPSPLDALNGIQRGFRIEVSRWTVTPSETFDAEPVEVALRSGSRFRQILEATDPDATITIWLYAEDFARFHELRELAHKLDLRVAARPLPAGTEISGSPGGSRSSAQ